MGLPTPPMTAGLMLNDLLPIGGSARIRLYEI